MKAFVQLVPFALVAVILIAGVYYSNGGYFPGVLDTGGTTLSMSQADFESSSSYFSGKQWILTFVQGGMGQSWIGTGSSNDAIGDKSGTEPIRDFYMKISMDKQECRYPVSKDSTMKPIYVYSYETWAKAVWESCDGTRGTRCGSGALKSLELLYDTNGGLVAPYTYCGCIGRTAVTTSVGTLKVPEVVATSTVSISRDGSSYESKTVELGKANAQVTFGNAVGIFSGYLSNGDSCDTQYDKAANQYYTFYNGGWKLGSMASYQEYRNALFSIENWFADWQSATARSGETLKNRVNTHNGYESTALKPAGGTFVNANVETPTGTTATSPYFLRPLKTPIASPLWTFYIKADWLGISQPVPVAKTLSGSSNKCKSGEGGDLTVSVKNSGETGNINVWATCTGSFSSAYSITQSFASGEAKSFTVPFDVNTAQAVSGICKICSHGNGDIGPDSCVSVGVSCDPQKICEPGTQICEGVGIKKCNAAGSGFDITQDCAAIGKVCILSAGTPACVDRDDGGNDDGSKCGIFDIACMLGLDKFGEAFGAIVGKAMIAAIIAIVLFAILYMAIMNYVPFAKPLFGNPWVLIVMYLLIFVVILAVIL